MMLPVDIVLGVASCNACDEIVAISVVAESKAAVAIMETSKALAAVEVDIVGEACNPEAILVATAAASAKELQAVEKAIIDKVRCVNGRDGESLERCGMELV